MGAASFGLSFEDLAREVDDRAILAVDWLGYGLSSRPKWDPRSVKEAEDWFCVALDQWREKNQFEQIVLAGHSMGGYLSVAYAERYPTRVHHLILVSPCGVPPAPTKEEQDAAAAKWPLKFRILRSVAYSLWDWGVTPQSVVRMTGSLGRKQVLHYPHRRFVDHDHWTQDYSKQNLGVYLWHMAAHDPSGESMLPTLLQPGAYAKKPLFDRIPKLEVGAVSFIYGASGDWMDWEAAKRVLDDVKSLSSSVSPSSVSAASSSRLCVNDEAIVRVPDAGHQLYFDNPKGFVRGVRKCLRQPNLVMNI